MQPVNSVATKCGASKLPNRIFGICPIGEDRRIPLWRRCIHHAAFGGLIGFLVLHPLSMVAHGIFHPGTFRIWQTLGVSFSYDHTAMTVYFSTIGVVFGLVHGIYIHMIEQLYEELRRRSITDELTGLYNRRFFVNRLDQELARARRYRHPLALLMIDIDHFKAFNDTHGHPAGDALLKELGRLLHNLARESDFAARYGGEEFVVVMPETAQHMALSLAERVGTAVSKHPFPLKEAQPGVSVTVSIGLAEFPGNARTMEELIQRADQALYDAKAKGRNQVCQSSPSKDDHLSACERL